jgi:hypothetical protein
MNITKEFLIDNDIITMFFTTKEGDINCVLRKKNKNLFFFDLCDEYSGDEKTLVLTITSKKNEKIEVTELIASVYESGVDYIIATIENLSNNYLGTFFDKIEKIDLQDEKYGRRQEERIKIGQTNYKLFGINSPEQKIYCENIKFINPCVIIDVSIHGICIITNYDNLLKKIENFNIHLSFINPIQTVNLKVHKVNVRLKKTPNTMYAIISCQLLEPINYIWKERVMEIIEKLNIENK